MLRYLIIPALILSISSCSGESEAPPGPTGSDVARAENIVIGMPAAHGCLTVFPLYLDKPTEIEEDYITLDDALGGKTVDVREIGACQGVDQSTVNAVEVNNRSGNPIYILAGQVIQGGKQDRVIARDAIVPPGETAEIEVCCVEQGRWSPRSQGSVQAMYCFESTAEPVANKAIKIAAQTKGREAQGEVWSNVAEECQVLDAQTSTGTYVRAMEVAGKSLGEFTQTINSAFAKDEKICGFVTCINGKVDSCDIFASPKLLSRFRDSLLQGYAMEALNVPLTKDEKKADVESVRRFIQELLEARDGGEQLARSGHARVEKVETKRILGFNSMAENIADADVLHMNAFVKD